MAISVDPVKRAWTLAERGLDFADVGRVFAGAALTQEDDRFAYPEPRFQTLWLARWPVGAGGVDADGRGAPRDCDKELP